MLYFKDSAMPSGIHAGFVEHDELDLTDQELAKLKSRARRAVTMDEKQTDQPRELPEEYRRDFLRHPPAVGYEDFLKGKS